MESSKSTSRRTGRSFLMSGAVALLAFAATGFTATAQARDNVYWSIGVGSPGVSVGVTNARPVYVQPQPVYVQPQPVYVRPRPVYVQPQPVYVQPAPVYVVPERRWHGKRHHRHHDRHHSGYYVQNQGAWVHGPQGFQPPGYYYGR